MTIMAPLYELLSRDIFHREKYRAQVDAEHPALKNDAYLHSNAVENLIINEISSRNKEIIDMVDKYAMPYLSCNYEVPYFGPCLQDLQSAHNRKDWRCMKEQLSNLCFLIYWH